MTGDNIPPCLIYIDKEGRWFHKGVEMIHREFIRLFYQNMSKDSEGRFIINLDGDCCYVDVEDTPYVVRKVIYEDSDETDRSRYILRLSDDTDEDLSPDSLYIGKDNVLYCHVKDGVFPARFTRPAYYQLAEYIEEKGEAYYLSLNGKNHPVDRKER